MFTKEEVKKLLFVSMLLALLIVVYQIVDNFDTSIAFVQTVWAILSPITGAFVIFYIINIPMKGIEGSIFKSEKIPKKLKRILSLIITLLLGGLLLAIFLIFAMPQLIRRVQLLIEQVPVYATAIGVFVNKQLVELNVSDELVSQAETLWTDFMGTFAAWIYGIINSFGTVITGFISSIFTAIISVAMALYMLLGKEHLQSIVSRLWRAYSPKSVTNAAVKYLHIVNESFEHFIRGQLLEALILGIICYIGMLIFGFEYPLLISFFVGLTNIIPLFGPYIGAVPSFLLLLMVNPIQALWFLVYLSVLQQIESNLIYPRVVGSSMGISGYFIMVAVIIGNSMFGIVGIIIGIPILSSLYIIIRESTERRIKEREAKEDDEFIEMTEETSVDAK